MSAHFFKRIINRILMRYFSVGQIATKDRSVYLTFDDGSEEGITQFVLDELDKYRFKGAFRNSCYSKNGESNVMNGMAFAPTRNFGMSITYRYSSCHLAVKPSPNLT